MVGVEDDKGGRYNRRWGITTPDKKEAPIGTYKMSQVDIIRSVMVYNAENIKIWRRLMPLHDFFLTFLCIVLLSV